MCQILHGEENLELITPNTADMFRSSQEHVDQEKTTGPYTEMVEAAEEARR